MLRIFTPRKSLGSCTNENVSGENETEKSCTNWMVTLRSQFTIIQSSDSRKKPVTFVYVYL